MIRVGILQIHPHTLWKKGGGELHARKYIELGNDERFHIEPIDFGNPDYDIIHYFGHGHQMEGIGEHARKQGIKVIGTPILYPAGKTMMYKAMLAMGKLIPFSTGLNLRQKLIHHSDVIIANSQPEKDFIAQAYGYPANQITVIGTGVNAAYLDYQPNSADLPPEVRALEHYALMIGRVTPLKSQLEVAQLFAGQAQPLLIVGQPDSSEQDYTDSLTKLVSQHENIHWIQGLTPDSNELKAVYAHALCHILWSKTEVAALVNMEAAALACPTICRNLPSTMSLMKGHSLYASKDAELMSQFRALSNWSDSVRKTKIDEAKAMIAASHTWERIVELSKQEYEQLISK